MRSIHSAASRPVVFIVCLLFHQRKCDVFPCFQSVISQTVTLQIPSGSNTFCRCCAAFISLPHASCYLTQSVHSQAVCPSSAQAVLRRCLKSGVLQAVVPIKGILKSPVIRPINWKKCLILSSSETYWRCLLIKKSPKGTKREVCVAGPGKEAILVFMLWKVWKEKECSSV